MRILTRYILKEVGSHALLGLAVFTFVIFVPHIGRLLEIVVRHNVPGTDALRLFILPIPGIVVLTIPMAVLVGTLIGLSRLSADGEIIAARASGIGLGRLVRPVMVLAIAGWVAALAMSLVLAPAAERKLHRMDAELRSSQVPYEIQPRVFIEQFPNKLLYLSDVTGPGSEWRGVFFVDSGERDSPKVTLAERGGLVNDAPNGRLMLHLDSGVTHETSAARPEQYSAASFAETDIPIPIEYASGSATPRSAPQDMTLAELLRRAGVPLDRQGALVELNFRLALPVASLVLGLVAIPLGLFARKGGKAVGLIVAVGIVFVYYILMALGRSLSLQGKLNPSVGMWLANALFAAAGTFMLSKMRRVRLGLAAMFEWVQEQAGRVRRLWSVQGPPGRAGIRDPRAPGDRLFQILDGYILRDWFIYLVVLLVGFTGISMIFDFFQLIMDIVRNHPSAGTVLNYYRYFFPQIAYLMFPLSILVATLVSFGLLTKTNQVTAVKSAGISLYRIAVPVLAAALVLSAGMFVLGDVYLPSTNQRQDSLRNRIKGKPPQTTYRPDRQWIFGSASRIYNYKLFDPDLNVFANLSVFEFDPHSFRLTRRIYAAGARWEPRIRGWVMEQGWVRDLDGDRVTSYMPFGVATFTELNDGPEYFKKEVRPSAEMSAPELRRYIDELSRSGFDVVRLSVQFYRKFAYPLMGFIVVLIGVPFALTTGSRGALAGVALGIGITLVYWASSSLFEALGNLSQLPPIVAAWSPDVLFGLGGAYLFLRVRT